VAKVSFLELDDDGFIDERPRFRLRKAVRDYPCPACDRDNRLTRTEADAGRICADCRDDVE
jgi:hypothetical protein